MLHTCVSKNLINASASYYVQGEFNLLVHVHVDWKDISVFIIFKTILKYLYIFQDFNILDYHIKVGFSE